MKKVELYKHNKTTYDNIARIFETGNRCAVVQPTGSGKSWLIMALAQDNPNKNIVVFEPNRYIISRVSEQMKEYEIENVEFLTYQKLIRMSDDKISNIKADYICLDELHRIAAKEWGKCVDTLFKTFPETKFLGLTATPNRTDNINIIDDFAGELACSISLGDAIVNKILPTPTYISALYTFDEEIAKVEKKIDNSINTDEEKEDMRKALTVAKHNLELSCGVSEILKKHIPCANGKYIVFCQNIDHLNNIRPAVLEWFGNAGFKVNDYAVHSKNAEKDKQFKAFDSDNSDRIKLLFCIAMLNEGVHLDNISGVILLRPTISSIIYFQQIGRAISASKSDNPIIFDLVNNADCVGYSSLAEEIETAVERNKAEDSENCNFNINDFHVYDYISDCVNVLTEIESRCVDEFDFRLKQLDEYKAKWGHCCVTEKNSEEYPGLNKWVAHIRIQNKRNKLSANKKIRLDEIQFVWNVFDKQWYDTYSAAYEYVHILKGIIIYDSKYNGYNIGIWLNRNKQLYKKGKLNAERIELLKKICNLDYNWKDENEKIWYKNYTLAKNLFSMCKNDLDCNSQKLKDKKKAESWYNNQIIKYRRNKLSEEKSHLLEELIILYSHKYNPNNTGFPYNYKLLAECINNGINITRNTKYKGIPIGSRLGNYKQSYKKGAFPEEHYQQLLNLGIDLAKDGGFIVDPA